MTKLRGAQKESMLLAGEMNLSLLYSWAGKVEKAMKLMKQFKFNDNLNQFIIAASVACAITSEENLVCTAT